VYDNFFFTPAFHAVFGSGIRDPGSRIQDPRSGMGKKQDPKSGMGKKQDPGSGINILNPQHCKKAKLF
jgi:hypothetical protein